MSLHRGAVVCYSYGNGTGDSMMSTLITTITLHTGTELRFERTTGEERVHGFIRGPHDIHWTAKPSIARDKLDSVIHHAEHEHCHIAQSWERTI